MGPREVVLPADGMVWVMGTGAALPRSRLRTGTIEILAIGYARQSGGQWRARRLSRLSSGSLIRRDRRFGCFPSLFQRTHQSFGGGLRHFAAELIDLRLQVAGE